MSVIVLPSDSTLGMLRRTYGLQQQREFLPDIDQVSANFNPPINSDLYICPLAFHGCEGSKDPEFYGRCAGREYPFLRCELYDSDQERRRKTRSSPTPRKSVADESFHDAFAEGNINPSSFIRVARNIFRNPGEYRDIRENCWSEWSEEIERLLKDF